VCLAHPWQHLSNPVEAELALAYGFVSNKMEVSLLMPKSKEFAVRLADQPGTLAKFCRALADRGVNIVAFQAFPTEGESVVRMVVDNPSSAKPVLDAQNLRYTETEVAQVRLPHRPGELARAASQLGAANININYAYAGVEPGANAPLLFFGVADVNSAAKLLDEAFAKAA
jgi:hypothetical protein